MEIIIILILLIAIIILSICLLKLKQGTSKPNNQPIQKPVNDKEQDESYSSDFDYSYMPYKKANLLTKTEYAFYFVLMQECRKRKIMVCPKVRLEDVAYVTDKNNRLKYRGYVKSRHIDFILVSMRCEILAGVELDDPSHDNEKAAKTDRFKNELFKTIEVPLIRIRVGTDYATELNTVFNRLNLTGLTTQTTAEK